MLQTINQDNGIFEVASLTHYTEGPAIDKQGNIYVTTLTGGNILKVGKRGKISSWAQSACPNGQLILPDGDHLICDSALSSIRVYDANGKFFKELIAGCCAGVPVQVPNDLVADSSGNIYFSDSVRHVGKIFMLCTNGTQELVTENLDYPNGLALSPDGRFLYVAESYKNRLLKVDLFTKNKGYEILTELPEHPSGLIECNLPDGLAVDRTGAIWVAHYGMGSVHQYHPDGHHLTSIRLGMPLVSNIAFINDHSMVVTGGFGEPGPGRIVLTIL